MATSEIVYSRNSSNAAKQKIKPQKSQNQTFIRPYFYHKLDQKQTKTCFFKGQNLSFQKLYYNIKQSNLYFNKSIFKEIIKLFVFFVQKALKMKIRLKADYSGKKMTNLRTYFPNGLISDQGLVKRTYLAALQQWRITHGSKCDVLFSQIMPSSRRVWVQNRV